jgi:hypothetical protein
MGLRGIGSIRAPKVLLHDHLDGGLRPQTVLDLAEEFGYQGLPASDAASLDGSGGLSISGGADVCRSLFVGVGDRPPCREFDADSVAGPGRNVVGDSGPIRWARARLR